MKRALLISVLVFFSNNSFSRELLPEEISVVEDTVREEMKDPDSAKFYHNDFPETETNSTYCGLVNGKNSYGAYSGKQLFSVFLIKNKAGEYKAISMDRSFADDEPLTQEVIAASCASAGYSVKVKKYLVKNVNAARKKAGLPPIDKSLISE